MDVSWVFLKVSLCHWIFQLFMYESCIWACLSPHTGFVGGSSLRRTITAGNNVCRWIRGGGGVEQITWCHGHCVPMRIVC